MNEYNTQGELVLHKRKLIEKIADNKDLLFIEAKDYVILSGRSGEADPREGLAKTFNSWKEAHDVAIFYDKHYSAKDKKEKNKIIVDSTKLTLKGRR